MKSNLSKKVITDKNGHRRTVWVRADNNISKKKHKVPFEPNSYYDQRGGAIDASVKMAESRGYDVDYGEVTNKVGTGNLAYEQTISNMISLQKEGKDVQEMLVISLYRMPSGRYELTTYIN